MPNLCECGCGLPVKQGNRFIQYHNCRGIYHPMYGKKHSPEARAKMRYPKTPEARAKMSLAKMGKKNPAKRLEVRVKISSSLHRYHNNRRKEEIL